MKLDYIENYKTPKFFGNVGLIVLNDCENMEQMRKVIDYNKI